MLKLFIISILSMHLLACSAATYRISSSPAEADVEVSYRSGVKKSIGKTPILLSAVDVNPGKEPLYLVLRKPGFETQSVFVPYSTYEKSLDLSVVLIQDLRTQDSTKIGQSMSQIASAVADIQKDIHKKYYLVAEQKLTRLVNEFPNISALYSLLGNVSYLEKKLDPALAHYRKALDLDPGSGELSRIIEKIQGLKSGGKQ